MSLFFSWNFFLERGGISIINDLMHNYIEWGKKVLEIERDAIVHVSERLGESFIGAAETCLETLQKKGKIVVVGIGKSGNIGIKIAATLNSTGSTAVVLDTQNALHGDIGLISEEDTVLAMSYSGETAELLTLLPHIKLMGVKIVAITRAPESTLGENADYVIDSSVEKEACPLRLAPTASSTATLALGDALAMTLLQARGFTADDFARFHPNGVIGKSLLMKTAEVMRKGERVPIVSQEVKVREALAEMSKKRAGACVIINAEKKLEGILTHGDFVRCYQEDEGIGEAKITAAMTKNPVTVVDECLAAEAVQTLRENKIDDLVVLNEQGEVVGLLDSQDLSRHQIL